MDDKNEFSNMNQSQPANNAISVYQDDGMEEFPVLKAFQKYIDAEQDKARRRLMILSAIFAGVLIMVIAVFVTMLVVVNSRNQALNDKLFEYVVRDRERQIEQLQKAAPNPDSALMTAMANKLDSLQKQLAEQEKATAKAAEDASTQLLVQNLKAEQERQIALLKSMLEAEKAKAEAVERERTRQLELAEAERKRQIELVAEQTRKLQAEMAEKESKRQDEQAERERKRQEEIEKYRRINFPELYEKPVRRVSKSTHVPREDTTFDDAELDALLKDVDDALQKLGDDDDAPSPATNSAPKAVVMPISTNASAAVENVAAKKSIPVEINGNVNEWNVPLE